MPDYSHVLARIANITAGPGENHWKGFCPVCQADHKRQSLRIWITDRGRLACKCYRSGCSFAEIAAAIHTDRSEWFPDPPRRRGRPMAVEIVDTYDYTDESGHILFQVQRIKRDEEKSFRCRRPIPGAANEWSWTLAEGFYTGEAGGYWSYSKTGIAGPNCLELPAVRMVPWLLHELAANPIAPVIVAEGEKDVKTLKAIQLPHDTLVTTAPGGSGRWLPSYGAYLSGRRVAIIPDNDEPGLNYALSVSAAALVFGASSIRLVRWPADTPAGEDISSYLERIPLHVRASSVMRLIRENSDLWERK